MMIKAKGGRYIFSTAPWNRKCRTAAVIPTQVGNERKSLTERLPCHGALEDCNKFESLEKALARVHKGKTHYETQEGDILVALPVAHFALRR